MGTALSLFLFKITPFITALAASDVTTSSTMDNVIKWGAGIGGGVIAIALIISIVKDGLKYAKGDSSGSVLQIVGKVAFLIICIGIIFIAVNYKSIGDSASTAANSAQKAVTTEASNALGNQ